MNKTFQITSFGAMFCAAMLLVAGCTNDDNVAPVTNGTEGTAPMNGTFTDDEMTDDEMMPAVGPDGKPMDQNVSPGTMDSDLGAADPNLEVQEVE